MAKHMIGLKRVITVSLSPDVIDTLDRVAQLDARSRSFVVDSLLRQGLIDRQGELRRIRKNGQARAIKADHA